MKPTLDDVNNIANKLLEVITPETILLFGSLAKGQENENSDVDLLIVWNDFNHLSHAKRRQYLRKIIGIVDYPVDILTCTEAELITAYNDRNSFTHAAIQESEVIYGRLSIPQ